MIVKICGLKTPGAMRAAAGAGAGYAGFNFFPKSPRYLAPAAARALAAEAPAGMVKVALLVDPDDDLVDEIAALPIDMIQLHGGEPPARVAAVRARAGLPVMKAVGVAVAADLKEIDAHETVADQLLVDARPAPGAALPGGNGAPFDWRLLAGRSWARPWLLAGGLTAANVAEAIRLTGARQVDVSSGVESAPGVKDEAKIRAFIRAANG
ncbi:MAG: phosphoribosylanthranilate isomerase [Pikeienuella sp.]